MLGIYLQYCSEGIVYGYRTFNKKLGKKKKKKKNITAFFLRYHLLASARDGLKLNAWGINRWLISISHHIWDSMVCGVCGRACPPLPLGSFPICLMTNMQPCTEIIVFWIYPQAFSFRPSLADANKWYLRQNDVTVSYFGSVLLSVRYPALGSKVRTVAMKRP